MRQGIFTNTRVRILCAKEQKTYRPRRAGERKRKSVHGAIFGHDIPILNRVVVRRGESEVPGLTDEPVPCRLGSKRANMIRTLFNLSRSDDMHKYVITRTFINKKGREIKKSPKIQRLVTPLTLHRKRAHRVAKLRSVLKNQQEALEYKKILAQRLEEKRETRRSMIFKKRSIRKSAKETAE